MRKSNQRNSIARSSQPLGFTLVELLVVIPIIGVLVSLLLPAVNSAREAARRMQCSNKIRNLQLAVINHESASGKLPASGEPMMRGSVTMMYTGPQFSCFIPILPYMEEQAIYDQLDLNLNVFEQPNGNTFENPVAIMNCPSDGSAGRIYEDPMLAPLNGWRFAKGNYACTVSPEHANAQRIFSGALISGGQSLRKIRDGLSKTLVLTEVRTRDVPHDQRGAWAIAWTGASLLAADVHSASLDGSAAGWTTPLKTRYIPDPDYFEIAQPPNNPPGQFNKDNLRRVPNEEKAACDLLKMPCQQEAWTTAAARSSHPGGVNASFGDGSVRFLQNSVDMGAYARAICVNDGLRGESEL